MNLLNLFRNANNVLEYKEGSIIFSAGDPGDVMYVVLDGEAEVRVGSQVVDVITPGNLLGEMALIDARARSATAVAKSDCRLAVVDQKLFLYMVQQTPFFSLEVMRVLADRLRLMNDNSSGS
jgi:CRP/FNR family transcriptional regulator, cyclic AMP receptor protein